eukprot:TRINITY_DN9_c0_g1_i1.p2 TRINITY_DN9_c0_g1~~TRINITY_DN9_c0_g1_i1.p2  ORF type:complete len:332 (-),score=105.41 TRINITY_DN9_c0_g1_i1:1464-2459(-)
MADEEFDDAVTALAAANDEIQANPTNANAYLKKGMAAFELEEYETAKSAFEQGQQLAPTNGRFKTWLRKCEAEMKSSDPAPQLSAAAPAVSTTPAPAAAAPTTTAATTAATTTTTTTPAPAAAPVSLPARPTIRYEWYQTVRTVAVTIFAKGVKKEEVKLNVQEKSLEVAAVLPSGSDYVLDLDLWGAVVPSETVVTVMSTKIEIELKKASPVKWEALEGTGQEPAVVSEMQSVVPTKLDQYPTSRPKKTNWDALVGEELKDDKPEGDEALNKLFQDIYGNGSDEQRRAMIKSFTESGGTVLSTNWDEVGVKEVKGSPPPGLEMHKYSEQK